LFGNDSRKVELNWPWYWYFDNYLYSNWNFHYQLTVFMGQLVCLESHNDTNFDQLI